MHPTAGSGGPGLRLLWVYPLLGGSWVVIVSGVKSPLIWVIIILIIIVTLLITPLITTHEPPRRARIGPRA